jgi:hypothetical protein
LRHAFLCSTLLSYRAYSIRVLGTAQSTAACLARKLSFSFPSSAMAINRESSNMRSRTRKKRKGMNQKKLFQADTPFRTTHNDVHANETNYIYIAAFASHKPH